MKLILDGNEIKQILLEWAHGFDSKFNNVEFEFSYGAFRCAEFSVEDTQKFDKRLIQPDNIGFPKNETPRLPAEPPADLPCNSKPQ